MKPMDRYLDRLAAAAWQQSQRPVSAERFGTGPSRDASFLKCRAVGRLEPRSRAGTADCWNAPASTPPWAQEHDFEIPVAVHAPRERCVFLQDVAGSCRVADGLHHDRAPISDEITCESAGIRDGPEELWAGGDRHQGQRLAERGRWRLQGRHISRERGALIGRSIDAALGAAGSDRRFRRDFPEQDQVRKSG